MDKFKLKAPDGVSEVSFGGEVYALDKDGTVEVPAEAVGFLCQYGFVNAPVEEPTAESEPEEPKPESEPEPKAPAKSSAPKAK